VSFADLLGTRWLLVEVGGEAVAPLGEERAAHLILDPPNRAPTDRAAATASRAVSS
jgi:hypothetical protein